MSKRELTVGKRKYKKVATLWYGVWNEELLLLSFDHIQNPLLDALLEANNRLAAVEDELEKSEKLRSEANRMRHLHRRAKEVALDRLATAEDVLRDYQLTITAHEKADAYFKEHGCETCTE